MRMKPDRALAAGSIGSDLPGGAGVPSRIRQLGQLSSSQPDLDAPQTGHISGLLTLPFVTSISPVLLQVGRDVTREFTRSTPGAGSGVLHPPLARWQPSALLRDAAILRSVAGA